MKYLYHVSPVGGLKELVPHASTHGVPYVYATENPVLSLLWGSTKSHRDLDGIYGMMERKDGVETPCFSEAFKNSFKERFEGESCYIYTVPADTFSHKTGFRAEQVSEVPVKVISCTKVDDLYAKFQEEIKKGNFILEEYDENDEKYVYFMKKHILGRILSSQAFDNPNAKNYNFIREKFPDLVKKVLEILEEK